MNKLTEELTFEELKEIYYMHNDQMACDCSDCREYRRQLSEHEKDEE